MFFFYMPTYGNRLFQFICDYLSVPFFAVSKFDLSKNRKRLCECRIRCSPVGQAEDPKDSTKSIPFTKSWCVMVNCMADCHGSRKNAAERMFTMTAVCTNWCVLKLWNGISNANSAASRSGKHPGQQCLALN